MAEVLLTQRCCAIARWVALFGCAAVLGITRATAGSPMPVVDAGLLQRIDTFIESEREASGIPGIALAIVHDGGSVHARGFGTDGRGNAVTADTPFPIGSLTKSFTALLVRQAVDQGRLDVDAPVRRYLPWFRVADERASARITLRHLLNQTSGLSRADGIAPLLQGSRDGIEALARGLAGTRLNRPVGERYEYSNLNFVLLAAVLEATSARPWRDLLQDQVLQPLAMKHSQVDLSAAQALGMTGLHQMVFGLPMPRDPELPPAFEPTGGLIASAADMSRYLRLLLDGGVAASGRVVSADSVLQLLAPAAPPARSTLLSADFEFRYAEGWFAGPFGAAPDARWHLGNLASFAAWMVLLPETKQAVVVLINANTELPLNEVNAVMSRLPIGVVNLLHGQPPRTGPSLQAAYRLPIVTVLLVIAALAAAAIGAVRARRAGASIGLAGAAVVVVAAALASGWTPRLLMAFAPELGIVMTIALLLLVSPLAIRQARRGHRRRP